MGSVTESYFTLPHNNAMEEALLPPFIHKDIEDQRKKLLLARSHNLKKKKIRTPFFKIFSFFSLLLTLQPYLIAHRHALLQDFR